MDIGKLVTTDARKLWTIILVGYLATAYGVLFDAGLVATGGFLLFLLGIAADTGKRPLKEIQVASLIFVSIPLIFWAAIPDLSLFTMVKGEITAIALAAVFLMSTRL